MATSAPKAWWRLDEATTTNGSAAVAYVPASTSPLTLVDGTYEGGVVNVTNVADPDVSQRCGNAKSFNGTSAFVQLPWTALNSPTFSPGQAFLAPGPSGEFSAEAWFKSSSASRALFVFRWYGYGLNIEADGKLRGYAYAGGLPRTVYSKFSVLNNVWHHAVLTKNASNLSLYVDGVLQDSEVAMGAVYTAPVSSPAPPGSGGVSIGRDGDGPTSGWGMDLFNGSIDEVAFYDRPLTTNEVAAHAVAGGKSVPGSPPAASQGAPTGGPRVGDPVTVSSGNFYDTWVDLPAPNSAFGLTWSRSYNSLSSTAGVLGVGWSTPFEQTVIVQGDGTALWTDDAGRQSTFTPSGANWLARSTGLTAQLIRRPDTSFALLFPDGSSSEFDLSGRIEQFVSWTGVTATIARTGATVNSITGSAGGSLTFGYTASRLTSVTASDGRVVSYGMNAQSNLTTVTDPTLKVWNITANAAGLVTKITDPAAVVLVETEYDGTRRAIKQYAEGGSTAPVPVFSTFVYDTAAKTTTVTSSVDASVSVFKWDLDWNVYAITDTRGKLVTNTFDQGGFLAGVTDRTGISSGATYDDRGRPLDSVDSTGLVTSHGYDTAGRLTSMTVPGVGTTTYTYETTERIPATITTPDAKVTTVVAGTDGLVSQVTDPDGVVTNYTYWPSRLVKTMTDAYGHTTSYDYDTAGRLTKTTFPDTSFSETTYDNVGRVLTSRGQDGGVTSYTYDNAGRVLTITDPLLKVTTNHYDSKGRLDWTRPPGLPDPAGRTTFTYNDFNQVLTTTRPGSATTTNGYDVEGRLTTVTDPMGRVTTYGYDDEGRRTTVTAPDGGVTTTVYDSAGRVWKTIDPYGRETVNAYNASSQLEAVTAPGGRVTTYTYDTVGRPWTVTTPLGGVTTTTYTNGGRVDTVTDPAGVVSDNTYNLAGQVTSVSTAGKVTGYLYDVNGRRSQQTAPTGPVTTWATTFNATGRVETTTAPSGVVTTSQYNKRGELVSQATTGQGTVSYTYNDSGTMATVTDAVGKVTSFGYDNRLNRTSRTNSLTGVDQWGYNLADEVTSTTDPLNRVTNTTVTYTTTGRTETSTDPTGRVITNRFDQAGRLLDSKASLTGQSDEYTTYAYNVDDTYCWTLTSTTAYGSTPDCSTWAPGGAALYSWNKAGQLLSQVTPESRITRHSYDTAGRLTTRVTPDGQQLNYTYKSDGTGWLDKVTPQWTIADSFVYASTSALDTAKWNAKSVVAGGDALVSFGALALSHTATAGSSVTVTSKMAAAVDEEVSAKLIFWDNTAGSRFQLLARYSATGSYRVEIDTGSTTAKVIRKVGTTDTQLGTFTIPASIFGYTLKLRVQGNQIRARLWAGNEPTTWDLDVTDAAPMTTAGQLRMVWSRVSGTTARNATVEEFMGTNLTTVPAAVATYTYNNNGEVTGEALVGGSRAWTYSPTTGQVTGFTQTLPGAAKTTNLTYDTSGRLRREQNGTSYLWYGYDNAGQLCWTLSNTSATAPTNTCATPPTGTGANVWTYDNLGRRASEKLGTATTVWYRYDTASQLCWTVAAATNPANTCAAPPAGATTYTHDSAGRQLTQTVTATNKITDTYDVAGRLSTLTRVNGATTTTQTRTYNSVTGLASKMSNVTGAATTYTYYDWTVGGLPELAGIQATPSATSTTLTSLYTSPVTGNWVAQQAGPTVTSLAQDVYGSTIAATGTTLQRSSAYNAWGVPTGTNTLEAKLGYRGELAIDTGLNLRARTYLPSTGQFTSTDPILGDPGSSTIATPYHYTGNNPINYTDPTGMKQTETRVSGGNATTSSTGIPGHHTKADVQAALIDLEVQMNVLAGGSPGCMIYRPPGMTSLEELVPTYMLPDGSCNIVTVTPTTLARVARYGQQALQVVGSTAAGIACSPGGGAAAGACGNAYHNLAGNIIDGRPLNEGLLDNTAEAAATGAVLGAVAKAASAARASAAARNATNNVDDVLTFGSKAAAREGLPGDAGVAANRFFRDATSKSVDFQAQALPGGGYRLQFFSPANNPGYGKLYVQEIDAAGNVIKEFKNTLGPDGLIETKWIHGGP